MLSRLRRRVVNTTGVLLQLIGLATVAYGVSLVLGVGWGVIAAGLGLFLVGLLFDNARPRA